MNATARFARALPGAGALLLTLLLAGLSPVVTAAGAPAAAPAAAPVPPGEPLYDVEMVVFRASALGAAEDWNVLPPGRGFGTNSGRSAQPPDVVRVLPSSAYVLDGVVRRLRTSGAWSPIAHAAWVQTAPPWGSHLGVPLSALGVSVPGLSGNVYLERAPLYMHLGFDLSLQGRTGTYTIDEMRNVRQNEKEYFDHPAFGIIAVVRALKAGTGRR